MIWWAQLMWFFALALGSFLVSWVLAGLLGLAKTPYVAGFSCVTIAFLVGYFRWSNIDWRTLITHQWLLGLVVAITSGFIIILLLAVLVRWQSLSLLPPPGPQGLQLVGVLLVSGVVNGAAEALLLSVLPVLIVLQAFSPFIQEIQWLGAPLPFTVALVASLMVITLHHIGIRELRGPLIIFVIAGNAVFTLAFLLTMNPLAAVIAHVMMHLGAELQRIEVPIRQEKRKFVEVSRV